MSGPRRRKDSTGKKTPLQQFSFQDGVAPLKYGFANDYTFQHHENPNERFIRFDENFSFGSRPGTPVGNGPAKPAVKRQDTKELLRQVNLMHRTIARSKSAVPTTDENCPDCKQYAKAKLTAKLTSASMKVTSDRKPVEKRNSKQTKFDKTSFDPQATESKSSRKYQLHDEYLSMDYESLTPSQFQEQINQHDKTLSKSQKQWEKARREAMLELINRNAPNKNERTNPYLDEDEQERIERLRYVLYCGGVNGRRFLKRLRVLRRIETAVTYDEDGVPDRDPDDQNRIEDEADYREFLEVAAVVLCTDLEIGPTIFHRASRGNGVPDRLYQLVDRATDGLVTADQVMEFIAGLQSISPRGELTVENLSWLENVFRRSVGENGEIRLNDFKNIVHSKNPFFVERVFHIFDKDDNGSISLQEFIDAMHQFAGQSPDDKIKFLFKVYDIDGDGLIQEKELQHVMRACMDENGMNFDEGEVDELTRALFHDATALTRRLSQQQQDQARQHEMEGHLAVLGSHLATSNALPQGITFEALKAQLTKHDGLLQNLSISIDRWLVPPKPKRRGGAAGGLCSGGDFCSNRVPHQLSVPYMRNNFQFLFFSLLLFFLNTALFASRIHEYWGFKNSSGSRNYWIIAARACGQCLNFNSMFLLVLMLRHSITKLREFGLNVLLPLDNHIYFHKVTGRLVALFSVVHTLAHLGNIAVNMVPDPAGILLENGIPLTVFNPPAPVRDPVTNVTTPGHYDFGDWLLTAKPGLFGLPGGVANPTGVALLVLLVVMVICSMKWVRKGGYFEVFYWSHLLYVPWWILLILHAPNFWKWFLVPAIVFVIEKFYRIGNSLSQKGKSWVTTGVVLPSRVVSLVIRRPPHFAFKPGDYIFINIPHIASFEWHPFTISSAPEQSDVITVHIRVVGHWTSKLYEYFEAEQKRLQCTLEGGPCMDPPRKYERLSKTVDRVRKTSAILTSSGAQARKESRRESTINNNQHGRTSVVSIEVSSVGAAGTSSSEGDGAGGSGVKGQPQQKKSRREAELEKLDEEEEEEEESQSSSLETTDGQPATNSPPDTKVVARSFRYMRRVPTIISYKPPEAEIEEESTIEASGETACTSSDHYILDRVNELDNNHNKKKKKSKHEEIFLRQPSTSALQQQQQQQQPKKQIRLERVRETSRDFIRLTKPLTVYIDGPFGAPTSQIFRAQHAVLIGTGIGVTPFASILQSIMHRYWQARNTCPKCHYKWTNDLSTSVLNLKKVDFFWINRDQRSFEWFVNLLSQLEIEQAEQGGAMERFLDMHMYITSALQKTDMKAVGLQLALDLLHKKSKRDLITGLKTRTNAGRPNWDKVFKQVQEQRKGKVTVFFCGSPQLGKILKLKCDEFGFEYRKENF